MVRLQGTLATKVLRKKRPELIPVIDTQAIFGAYMGPTWPGNPASGDSTDSMLMITEAPDRIVYDLRRDENAVAWTRLRALEPGRRLTEIFDMVWWSYFRIRQPYARQTRRELMAIQS